MPRSKSIRFFMMPSNSRTRDSISRMVEVAWPISWISRALLYRTSLSRRVSSAALRWASTVSSSILRSKPLGLDRAEADQDEQRQAQNGPGVKRHEAEANRGDDDARHRCDIPYPAPVVRGAILPRDDIAAMGSSLVETFGVLDLCRLSRGPAGQGFKNAGAVGALIGFFEPLRAWASK